MTIDPARAAEQLRLLRQAGASAITVNYRARRGTDDPAGVTVSVTASTALTRALPGTTGPDDPKRDYPDEPNQRQLPQPAPPPSQNHTTQPRE